MVLLISIILFKCYEDKAPTTLASAFDLSSFGFFQKRSAGELATFASRETIGKIKPGERCSLDSHGYKLHAYIRPDGLSCAITSDEDYPPRIAFNFMQLGFEEFLKLHIDSWKGQATDVALSVPKLEELLKRFQKPMEEDKVSKIQSDLDQTKNTIIKSMEQVIERGETFEILAQRSEDLSFQSKLFLKRSEDINDRCCILL